MQQKNLSIHRTPRQTLPDLFFLLSLTLPRSLSLYSLLTSCTGLIILQCLAWLVCGVRTLFCNDALNNAPVFIAQLNKLNLIFMDTRAALIRSTGLLLAVPMRLVYTSLPETGSLPSAWRFAECNLSGTWQATPLSSASGGTLGEN
jgi:hypothetical protein